MRLTNLYETHTPVSDLAASVKFHSEVVGPELALEQTHKNVAFMWVGVQEKRTSGLRRVQAGRVFARMDISVQALVQAFVTFTVAAVDSSRNVFLARLRRRDVHKETESLYDKLLPGAAP